MKRGLRTGLKRLSKTDGMAAVEFAVILSVFLMLLLGIVEFGYDWYIRQALTNASRNGARYGVLYQTDGAGNPVTPANKAPSIENKVKGELTGDLPSAVADSVNVTCSGTAWTAVSYHSGDALTVTVTATKDWSGLASLLGDSFSNMTITVQSTMNLE